jgi:hypothetical protein
MIRYFKEVMAGVLHRHTQRKQARIYGERAELGYSFAMHKLLREGERAQSYVERHIELSIVFKLFGGYESGMQNALADYQYMLRACGQHV